jgi:hypothetical protein
MAPGQDWCLQCGAGAPGSLSDPGWRSAGAVLGVVALLALAAAVAGYAALEKSPKKAALVTQTVAVAPVTPAATPAAPATPATPAAKAALPATPVKPPKIPLTAATPKAANPKTTTTTPANKTTTTPTTPAKSETGGAGEESKPVALLLDTNAASTYNPYNLPVTGFGDPSLTIDGDTSTAWTAQVDPATAPAMAEGLLIDMRIPQRLGSVELITSSPGMTIQIYGANGASEPSSITAPGWTRLTHSITLHKRHVHLSLLDAKHSFRWLTLWISKASPASVGTAQEPGHVSINEVELFPAS